MLRQLRSATGKYIFAAAAAVVIPSFVVFYGWNSGARNEQAPDAELAVIHTGALSKVKITNSYLAKGSEVRKSQLAQAMSYEGQKPDITVVTQLADERESFLGALDLHNVEAGAEALGVHVGPQQVIATFAAQVPEAQRDDAIRELESRNQMRFEDIVQTQARQRTLGLTQSIWTEAVRVPLFEAWLNYCEKNEKLTVDYVRVDSSKYVSELNPSEADLKAYLAANTAKFRIPAQAEYQYIVVSKQALRATTTVTDDEVTSAYELTKETDYRLPKAVRAQAILLETPTADSDATATAAAEAKVRLVMERAAKGEDFAQLHEQFSKPFPMPTAEPGSKPSDTPTTGGHFGFISEATAKTSFGDEATSALFTATPGMVLGPVKGESGAWIFKVGTARESFVRPLADVKNELRAKMVSELVDRKFESIGNELKAKESALPTLLQLATATGTTVTKSGKVNKNSAVLPSVGLLGEMSEAVHDLERNKRSEVMSDTNRHLVIELTEEHPAYDPELKEVQLKVESEWRNEKALDKARQTAKALAAKAGNATAFATAVSDAGLTVTRSNQFTRDENNTVFGGAVKDFAKISVGQKVGETITADFGLFGGGKPTGAMLVTLISREEPSQKDFAEALPKISTELMERKRAIFLSELLQAKRRSLADKVEIRSSALK